MVITVTRLDILLGFQGSPCNCPIAKAVERVVGVKPLITTTHANIGKRRYPLPLEARRFINEFDVHGKNVCSPFTFTLNESFPL